VGAEFFDLATFFDCEEMTEDELDRLIDHFELEEMAEAVAVG
jgi:hypothetical protein